MLLAFDTSGPVGSVAVALGTDVLARGVMTRQKSHAAMLVPTIRNVLDEAGVDREEIARLVVGEGPGSFTGVRVAAATAKGFSHALGVPLHAVSSLAAAAFALEGGPIRYAVFDARADRVYGACWEVGAEKAKQLVAPHAAELPELLAGVVPAGAVFAGDAAIKHRAAIERAGFAVYEPDASRSRADGLVDYVARVAPPPVEALGEWEPAYLRSSGAERLRKR